MLRHNVQWQHEIPLFLSMKKGVKYELQLVNERNITIDGDGGVQVVASGAERGLNLD